MKGIWGLFFFVKSLDLFVRYRKIHGSTLEYGLENDPRGGGNLRYPNKLYTSTSIIQDPRLDPLAKGKTPRDFGELGFASCVLA